MALFLTPEGLDALDAALTRRSNPVRRPREYAEQVLGPLALWAAEEAKAAARNKNKDAGGGLAGGNTKTEKTDIGGMLAGTNKKLAAEIVGEDWEVQGIALASASSLYDLARNARSKKGLPSWNLSAEEWERVRKANFCSGATEGCIAVCLRNSGQMVMQSATKAQIRRSLQYLFERPSFLMASVVAIAAHYAHCRKKGYNCAFRLNITSDLAWENTKVTIPDWVVPWLKDRYGLHWVQAKTYDNICEVFNHHPRGARWPAVQFYDYTKVAHRIKAFSGIGAKKWPTNYWLTWSLAETDENRSVAAWVLQNQVTTVTVPFARTSAIKGRRKGEPLPLTLTLRNRTTGAEHTYPVLDGDAHDLRFLDAYAMDTIKGGAFIGLHFKTPNDKANAGRGIAGKIERAKGFIVTGKGEHLVIDYTPARV